jgi:hypothetical protein
MLSEREKQTYILGYMKCVNEVMAAEFSNKCSRDQLASFTTRILCELSADLEIKIPNSEMTKECSKLYNTINSIAELWTLK